MASGLSVPGQADSVGSGMRMKMARRRFGAVPKKESLRGECDGDLGKSFCAL